MTTCNDRFQLLCRFGLVECYSKRIDAFARGLRDSEREPDSGPYAVFDVMAHYGQTQTWNLINDKWRAVERRNFVIQK